MGIIYPSVVFSPNGRFLFFKESIVGQKIFETDSGKVMWAGPPLLLNATISQDNRLLSLPEANGFKIVNFDDFQERVLNTKASTGFFSPESALLRSATLV